MRRRATYDDIKNLPEHLVGEIIDGELLVTPRPSVPHAVTASAIGSELFGQFHRPPGGGGPGGWWIVFEPELHFGADVAVPDLAGWRRERMPALPNAPAIEVAPDWVCEVLSPSTTRIDRVKKTVLYARVKVAHYWIVDPLARVLEIHRLTPEGWLLAATYEGEARIRAEPFEAVELDMARWWIEATAPRDNP